MRKTIFVPVLLIVSFSLLLAMDAKDVIKKVQKKYDHIKNFQATFEKIETFQLTGSREKSAGKLFIKNGKKYRFETEDQWVISDGKTVWTFNRINNQVLIDKVRKNSGALLPRDILFKYPKTHFATLVGQEKRDGKKVYIIKLEPKEDNQGYFSSVKIWVENRSWNIVKIEVTDLNGNKSIFELSKIDTKSTIPDSLFTFTPQPDVNVVDMRE
jgi:chaperone LolA